MTDGDKDVLALMSTISLTGAMVIWSNVSLHGGWTGESFFFTAGLMVGGFLAFGGVMYREWKEDAR